MNLGSCYDILTVMSEFVRNNTKALMRPALFKDSGCGWWYPGIKWVSFEHYGLSQFVQSTYLFMAASIRIMCYNKKLRSSQTSLLNMTVSSLMLSSISKSQSSCALLDMVEQICIQMCSQHICNNCVMLFMLIWTKISEESLQHLVECHRKLRHVQRPTWLRASCT